MKKFIIVTVLATSALGVQAQSLLYPKHFDLEQVTLLDGPMKTAMDKNIQHLMQYDVDRLLTPFVRQSGLPAQKTAGNPYAKWEQKHPNFGNWGGDAGFDLSGHVGGHYLSALALAYAASHDEAQRAKLKERMDYMLKVMKDCQDQYDQNTEGLYGFIGGQPINDSWKALYKGDLSKIQRQLGLGALLRSAQDTCRPSRCLHLWWQRRGQGAVPQAGRLERQPRQQSQCQRLRGLSELRAWRHERVAARRLPALWRQEIPNGSQEVHPQGHAQRHADAEHHLPRRQARQHAGAQVHRHGAHLGEQDNTAKNYLKAAENFWQDVAQNRTVCIGGNSVGEHFLAKANSNRYIDQLDGPESCNTNNMLKLSEMLADRTGDAKYADFYEQAMWNHILSTQDPETGGYVYFTTLRPQGYRIYSTGEPGHVVLRGHRHGEPLQVRPLHLQPRRRQDALREPLHALEAGE